MGVGITREEAEFLGFPEPREMMPVSIEEQIVTYADKFFSKTRDMTAAREKSVAEIAHRLKGYGHHKAERFQAWVELFEG